ncbi:hypothetical protein SPBR_04105 [Sporothrix brasiliensis 5110]|uniref:HAM1-like N-terminal domain-containing protein n=1 Tax=Sporothrix brasiliensis 5110 TaxID=1398154 RepID=A0A0C2IWS3_9PEZI|nr:uncharacterized protein SPBR_04105 [Sporothrix brasiliensis 5110]KIH93591.1 hypothetical protein SPBR_04105 [Sporothrix brasiliensis 5110]
MSCCGLCGLGSRASDYEDGDARDDGERRPLLANGDEETQHQRTLHQKLHTYQMVRAMGNGYLPSTTQAVANLRRLKRFGEAQGERGNGHSRPNAGLSPAGQRLSALSERWVDQLITLAERKNGGDQIQDFAWCVRRARLSVDVGVDADDLGQLGSRAMYRAGQAAGYTSATYQSLQTVATLLLTNAPFRLFLADLAAVGRDVFRDTAQSLAAASQKAADNVAEVPADAVQATAHPPEQLEQQEQPVDGAEPARETVAAVADEVVAGASQVAADAQQSVAAKLVDNDGGARERLLGRLKEAVGSLRQRPDYAESVSTLTLLIQKYAETYVRAAEEVVDAVEEAVDEVREGAGTTGTVTTNEEADVALRNFWSFLTSFGDPEHWTKLERQFRALLDRTKGDSQQVDAFVRSAGRTLQDMLTDPAFFDDVDGQLGALKTQGAELDEQLSSSQTTSSTSIREDVDALLAQFKTTLQSVANDQDVASLVSTSTRMADILWPAADGYVNTDLLGDAVSVYVPRLVQAVQYVPVPRLEIVSRDVDLLLEGLVLEPGRHHDVHAPVLHSGAPTEPSSFLPHRLQVQIRNDVDIHSTHVGHRHTTGAAVGTSASIHVRGLSVAADDFGYVVRVHAGLFRFHDEGIASFHLDERGVDVHLEVDAVRGTADRLLQLKRVRVHIHHLGFTLRKSKFAWLAWLLTPLLRPLLKTTLERQIASSIADSLGTINQELVFARERLRAATIAAGGGSSLETIVPVIRAVFSRYKASVEENPDVDVSVGFQEGATGVFDGVYAPGSLVRVWREEAEEAQARIDEEAASGAYVHDGWRNGIFDVPNDEGL